MLRKLFLPIIRKAPRNYFSEIVGANTEDSLQSTFDPSKDYLLDFENIDLEDYRDLDQKIKQTTGYALLHVEPFPRMKIMKLGLIILENLRTKIPEDAMYRIYMGGTAIFAICNWKRSTRSTSWKSLTRTKT